MDGKRLHPLSALFQPRRAITGRGPQSASLPTAFGIVNSAIEPFGVKAQQIRHAEDNHLAILHGDQTIVQIARRHRNVLTQTKRVVLINPRVITRFRTVFTNAVETGPRVLIKRPPFGAVIARRLGSVQRAFALFPIEAPEMAAGKRYPDDSSGIDVAPPHSETRRRNFVDLSKRRFRRVRARFDTDNGPGITTYSAPDRAIHRIRHDGVKTGDNPFVLCGIDGLVGFDVLVALAIPVCVEDG